MELLLDLQPSAILPLYQQLASQLRRAIIQGDLAPGRRLPGGRELASTYGIARNTVTQAYTQLVSEGYLEGRERAGYFVSRDLPDASMQSAAQMTCRAAHPQLPRLSQMAMRAASMALPEAGDPLPFDFSQRTASDRFPLAEWRSELQRVLSAPSHALLEYGEPAGYWPLRETIAAYAARSRGVVCTPEQVIITSGSRQGCDLVLRTLLEPGDAVALEEPGYPNGRKALLAAGVRVLPVPVDERGLQVERLEGIPDVRLVYVTPSNQYPTGVTLELPRRLALLDWARRTGAWVVEDDYDGDFRYTGRPLPSLQGLGGGQVIYMGTFAKSLAPGLRLGYLVVPTPLIEPFAKMKWLTDRQTASLSQAMLANLISGGGLERHLRRARKAFAHQRDALLAAFARHLPAANWRRPDAGMHVEVQLPGIHGLQEEEALVAAARSAGIGLQSARLCYTQVPWPGTFLFWFSHLPPERLEEGIQRLARVLDAFPPAYHGERT